ncbi:hypothetical protein CHU98_g6626 [Xylaria longipes]|nr:hypothetical protein CHU98_g6626 [Xylaria longipes]
MCLICDQDSSTDPGDRSDVGEETVAESNDAPGQGNANVHQDAGTASSNEPPDTRNKDNPRKHIITAEYTPAKRPRYETTTPSEEVDAGDQPVVPSSSHTNMDDASSGYDSGSEKEENQVGKGKGRARQKRQRPKKVDKDKEAPDPKAAENVATTSSGYGDELNQLPDPCVVLEMKLS